MNDKVYHYVEEGRCSFQFAKNDYDILLQSIQITYSYYSCTHIMKKTTQIITVVCTFFSKYVRTPMGRSQCSKT